MVNYIFDFDGTLITPLDINYANLRIELCRVLGLRDKLIPLTDKINYFTMDNLRLRKRCYDLLDRYELEALDRSTPNYKCIDLYINSKYKMIVSKNSLLVIKEFINKYKLPKPDYISCRDNNNELKPSIQQLNFIEQLYPELYKNKANFVYIGDSDCDKQLAINYGIEYIDINLNNMLHIDIFIPFYNFNNEYYRTHLTRKTFKHYSILKSNLMNYYRVLLTFTLVGSEKDLSRDLAKKYFPETYYYEFDQSFIQNDKKVYDDFNDMFFNKMNYGVKMSYSKNPDIVFCAGSNDYIPETFFINVIEYYKNNKPQIYGIDNYYNGLNCVYFAKYDPKKEEFINNDEIWWDGVSNFSNRERYHYCGGIIGVNKFLLDNNKDFINKWGFDEGETEENALKIDNIDKFNSKNLYFFNVKTVNDNDLNTMDSLHSVDLVRVNIFNDLPTSQYNNIINDLEYYQKIL